MDPAVEKAKTIVKKLSMKQKVHLLYGDGDWKIHSIKKTPFRAIEMHDGPLGLRNPNVAEKPTNGDMVPTSAPATCFPAPCLTACSWDPDLLAKMSQNLAKECLLVHTDIILAPGANIKRNPLCGRNFEYLSEDPLLAGKMAAGYISGVQSQGVGVSLKHFAANNQEYRRFNYSAEVDERALREIYLKPFEIAVKEANPWTIMCSYNRINGVYSSDNDWLLKTVLRDEWGYSGIVVSDWGATNDPIRSHNDGLDLEMPCHEKRDHVLLKAIKKGTLNKDAVNAEALHLATLLVHLTDDRPEQKDAFNVGISHQAALEMAEESIVLAKNEDHILPLKNLDDVCLIGALAKQFRYQGAGSSKVIPHHLVTLYEALNEGRDPKDEIKYEAGYPLKADENAKALLLGAIDLASSHKNVILCLGLPEGFESEGYDRKDMRLPEEEYTLVDALYSVNKNLIVVFLGGAPAELPFADKIPAILIAYLPGEAGGDAIKNILLGEVNPSGKLAETWPLHYLDVPNKDFYPGNVDVSPYKESIFVGYRYYQSANKNVLFPFGHGLSYTSFKYADFALSKDQIKAEGTLKVSFKLANNGKVEGKEVAQLYISARNGKTFKPLHELKSFVKVSLAPGKSKTVIFTLPYSAFAHWDEASKKYQVEGGQYLIEVGSSSEDIRLSGFVEVLSNFVASDRRSNLPSYYNMTRVGPFHVADDEFERLLGHDLPVQHDLHHKPFTLNSTLEEISGTFIGKKIKKMISKQYLNSTKSEEEKNALMGMMMESPIRMISMAGLNEKKMFAVLDMANGHYLKAFFDVQFGTRK
jgi:beta-glucosidase